MNETINDKLEKDNQKHYYILILKILKKYENIKDKEINSALNPLKMKKMNKIENKKNNNNKIKNFKKIENKGANCNICIIFILFTIFIPLLLAAFFAYIILNNNIIYN